MKKSPDTQKLEEILRSPAFSAEGFMGSDMRSLAEIIDADIADLAKLNYTPQQIVQRMQQITDKAKEALGNWIKIDDTHNAMITEVKGRIPCPWPHAGNFAKRVTTVWDTSTGRKVHFSDLNIHLIAEHNFFEGRGSTFRIEPKEIVEMLF
jgi:hypothetical protein